MKQKLILIFSLAILIRLLFLLSAHHGDLNNNISWGALFVERGPAGYYEAKDWSYSAPNQPPLTILMFGSLMWLFNTIDSWTRVLNDKFTFFPSQFIWFWELRGKDILVKLPSILADLGIGYLIYKYFIQLNKKKTALAATTIWLFNPVVWFNSSIWGQTDPIVNLLGLFGIMALQNKKLVHASIWFTLSILFKGSLFVLAPVLLFYAVKQKHTFHAWAKAAAASLATLYIVCLAFYPSLDLPVWLYNLYTKQILPGEIGFLTANAFNLWWLVDSGKTLDSTMYLGLPARIWGFVLSISGIFGTLYLIKNKIEDKKVWYALAVSALVTFLFMTRIHERYLYPFFPAGTILAGLAPAFTVPYALLSASHLFNLFHLFPMPWQLDLNPLYSMAWFIPTLSIINLSILFWILKAGRKYT